MARDFYPFVENGEDAEGAGDSPKTSTSANHELLVRYPARIAVYDDAAAAPRVVVVEAQDVRPYLEEITATVDRLAKEQGGSIPFMVVREVVENFIHAYFIEPTISILDGGDTIRFSDQGPGIREKDLALQYGTTSATEEMKQYIRGVGSGLPYAQQYMVDHGGSLTIEDNIAGGTIVTISNVPDAADDEGSTPTGIGAGGAGAPYQPGRAVPVPLQAGQPVAYGYPPAGYQQPTSPMPFYGYPQPGSQQAYQGYQQYQPYPAPQEPYQPQTQQRAASARPSVTAQGQYQLSERDLKVISYLVRTGATGPTDLMNTYGNSQPTWTRELQKLERAGFVRKKRGAQKYTLTDLGFTYAQLHGI